jgi:hypothetical protein
MVSLAIWKKIHSWVSQRLKITLVQFWSSLKNSLMHVFSKLHSKPNYYPYTNVSVFIVVKYFTVVVFKDLVLINIFTTHLRISRESRVYNYILFYIPLFLVCTLVASHFVFHDACTSRVGILFSGWLVFLEWIGQPRPVWSTLDK